MYGLLALLLAWCAARRVLEAAGLPQGPHTALAAAAVGLGSPLLFYMYVSPGFAHATSAFAVSAFVLAWIVVRRRWTMSGLVALGALAGLMAMVREQDAFVVVGPAIDFAWTAVRQRRLQALGPAIAGAAAAGLVYLPQAAAYLALNGRLWPSRLVSRKMTWTSPHALGVLVSPEHGLFFWTPLALVAVAGLVLLIRRRGGERVSAAAEASAGDAPRRIGIGLLAIVIGQVYVAGSVESWTVAGAFGQRRFVAMTAPFVIGLAVAGARLVGPNARRAAAVIVGLCVWWNLGLMVQFGAGLMDRQRLDLRLNAYNTFIEVPRRLPDIVYRYLFDRGSFFRPAPPGGPS
jgi:hypothetical protein